ncbi:MAG: hypothetical protein V8R91_08995 [Butyricimonas faecihominis]
MFALSLHPLKRDRGMNEAKVEAAFWWCDDDLWHEGNTLNEALEKKFEKTSKKIWKERKNALSLHPLSLLKKRGR